MPLSLCRNEVSPAKMPLNSGNSDQEACPSSYIVTTAWKTHCLLCTAGGVRVNSTGLPGKAVWTHSVWYAWRCSGSKGDIYKHRWRHSQSKWARTGTHPDASLVVSVLTLLVSPPCFCSLADLILFPNYLLSFYPADEIRGRTDIRLSTFHQPD